MNAATTSLSDITSPVGLIAGNGHFPLEFAQRARAHGLSVVVVAIHGEADKKIESLAERCTWVKLGQFGKLIRSLKSSGVKQAAFLGGITRVDFVGGFRIDWRGLKMLSRLRSFNDDAMLRGIIRELEESGISVIAPTVLLEESVPKRGVITGRKLQGDLLEDAKLGWDAARTLGALDIGQSVVVRNKTIVAVEAVEGTDATIGRAANVRGGPGVLVKLAKPIQDLRVDLPAIGVRTIEGMHSSNLKTLILEAGKCLMHEPQAIIQAAIARDITIIAAECREDLATVYERDVR